MKRKTKIEIITSLCLLLVPTMSGQLHESIKVDGKYIPDIIRIDRINAFPKVIKSTVVTSPIGYEEKGVAASFNPSLIMAPATGWRATYDFSNSPGYLELGAGSWLNSTLSAGYRFIDNSTSLFGMRLQHNSTSLWKTEITEATKDVKQFRYDESLGLYGSYFFKDYGRLDAAIDYHLGYFNYYGYSSDYLSNEDAGKVSGMSFGESLITDKGKEAVGTVPTQTINDVAFRLDWTPDLISSSNIMWKATARMRHFAYREFMSPAYEATKGGRETDIGLDGSFKMKYGENSNVGIDGSLDIVWMSQKELDNYAMFTLTPYYRFSKGKMNIRLGADIDLSFKAGLPANRYSLLHVAPDVRFSVKSKRVGFYLDVLGGSQLNTLAHLHQLDYYGLPLAITTRPVYSPLDATAGANFGPFSGFSLGFKGRYKINKNVPLGGWYMAWLDNASAPMTGMVTDGLKSPEVNYCGNAEGINLHGYSLSAFLRYDYGKSFSVSADGSYQPQDGKKGFFDGYDRPEVKANFKVFFKPVSQLSVSLGYVYRGDRKIYTKATGLAEDPALGIETEVSRLCSLRLADLNLVNLSLAWDFNEKFTIWLQGDNLLNRHDTYLPLQPTQGIVIVGGFKLLF